MLMQFSMDTVCEDSYSFAWVQCGCSDTVDLAWAYGLGNNDIGNVPQLCIDYITDGCYVQLSIRHLFKSEILSGTEFISIRNITHQMVVLMNATDESLLCAGQRFELKKRQTFHFIEKLFEKKKEFPTCVPFCRARASFRSMPAFSRQLS